VTIHMGDHGHGGYDLDLDPETAEIRMPVISEKTGAELGDVFDIIAAAVTSWEAVLAKLV